VALVAIVIGVFFYLANVDAPAEHIAQRIFLGLIVLSVFFCLFAGRRATADCLSEEKRQGTLGLLFLTDLKGYDIVLGKLAATSLNGFYGLLAVFPVLAVPILLGGVSNAQFWRVVLVLANTFIFSLAVGMFVSAVSRDARRAMGANLLLLLLLIGTPGACGIALATLGPGQRFHPQLLLSCPLYSLYLCDDSMYRLQRPFFWWSIVVIHLLTWLLLGLASWAVRRSWQDKPTGTHPFSWNELWRLLRFGPAGKRAQYRKRLLDANPFYWLAARSKYKPFQVWAVLLFVAGWWVWAHLQFGSIWLDDRTSGTNLATVIMLSVALKLWVGLEAGRPLAEERQSGSFELLLSTPLSAQDILGGQVLALKRQFLAPAIVSALVALLFMFSAIYHSPGDYGVLFAAWLGGILMFTADLAALFWTAMYRALTTRSPNQAATSTISRIVIAPALVFGAVVVLVNLYSYLSQTPAPKFEFYMACWIGLSLATDLAYGLTARRQLLTCFRLLAGADRVKRPIKTS
jgi:ABC-type Na+ efflux pump permease subunit